MYSMRSLALVVLHFAELNYKGDNSDYNLKIRILISTNHPF